MMGQAYKSDPVDEPTSCPNCGGPLHRRECDYCGFGKEPLSRRKERARHQRLVLEEQMRQEELLEQRRAAQQTQAPAPLIEVAKQDRRMVYTACKLLIAAGSVCALLNWVLNYWAN